LPPANPANARGCCKYGPDDYKNACIQGSLWRKKHVFPAGRFAFLLSERAAISPGGEISVLTRDSGAGAGQSRPEVVAGCVRATAVAFAVHVRPVQGDAAGIFYRVKLRTA